MKGIHNTNFALILQISIIGGRRDWKHHGTRHDLTPEDTAFREFHEETGGVLKDHIDWFRGLAETEAKVFWLAKAKWVLYVIRLDNLPQERMELLDELPTKFESSLKASSSSEMEDIRWVDSNLFRDEEQSRAETWTASPEI